MGKLQDPPSKFTINLETREEKQIKAIYRAAKRDAPNMGFLALFPGCDHEAFAGHVPLFPQIGVKLTLLQL